jgi:hypothetical protein
MIDLNFHTCRKHTIKQAPSADKAVAMLTIRDCVMTVASSHIRTIQK